MDREKKLVSLCLVILFISLIVVYCLLYQVRGSELITSFQIKSWSAELALSMGTGSAFPSLDLIHTIETIESSREEWTSSSQISNSWVNNSNITVSWSDASTTLEPQQPASSDEFPIFQGQTPHLLSGTDIYFGLVEGVEKLGLQPEYLLRDKKDIYYAYFPENPEGLRRTVQQLWGNIYTISSESELLKHQLFGEKVSFINLPEYKDKLVLILLEVNGQHRLLQIPYTKYHTNKSYLNTLFM